MQTFGSIALHSSQHTWIIRCEPHVRSRLKRVFPRAPQKAGDTVTISNTPENSRDLLWFLERYPMEVERLDVLRGEANAHRQSERKIQQLLANRRPPLLIDLAKPAREYQVFVAQVLEVKSGLLCADDVGLGKTVTAICSMVVPENLPALVVCPTHLPGHWLEKIAEFAPALSVHVINKGSPYEIKRAFRGGRRMQLGGAFPDVLVISYHKLRGWADTLAGSVRLVVFDECQQLRNSASEIYSAAAHVALKAMKREGLSATPIYNYGSEFFYVIDALVPGALGTREEFVREWCAGSRGGEKARLADAEEFGAYLRREGIMVRRTRSEVGRELPALTKVVHTVESDAAALDQLGGNAVALARIVLTHNERFRGEKMQAAGELDAILRQATGIAKAPYVAEFVRLVLDSEERIVLFGWHRAVYDIWLEALAEFEPALYTGSESPTQKAASIERFTKGETRVLIMSLRSGAGVDGLQGYCRTPIFGELDWSPGVHEQCIGRLHRDGQDEKVVAYFLVTEDGADPVMIQVNGVKREQIERVRNPGGPLVERIDTGENNIARLARDFLKRRGQLIPEGTQVLEFESAGANG